MKPHASPRLVPLFPPPTCVLAALLATGPLAACADMKAEAPATTAGGAYYDVVEGQQQAKVAESTEEEAPPPAAAAPALSARAGGAGREKREANEAAPAAPEAPEDKPSEPEKPSRAWFPETFLFAPQVHTDAQGVAVVPVRIPDRLTGWRVLGLGHTKAGAFGGTLTRIQGTLPVYVELVVPAFLRKGDQVELPVQYMNTTEGALTGRSSLTITGGSSNGLSGNLLLGPQSELLLPVTVRAEKRGNLSIEARFRTGPDPSANPNPESASGRTEDGVLRSIPVQGTGEPVEATHTGTLARKAQIRLGLPANQDPEAARLQLAVSPGTLPVLKAEMSAPRIGSGAAEAAYALWLVGAGPELRRTLGEAPPVEGPDAAALREALRKSRLEATQVLYRIPAEADPAIAAVVLGATAAHPGDRTLRLMTGRLADGLRAQQAPDGTFPIVGTASTLPHTLALLADVVRALDGVQTNPALTTTGPSTQPLPATAQPTENLRQIAREVHLRGEGAVERLGGDVNDPWTAACLLAAGLVNSEAAPRLLALIAEAKGEPQAILSLSPHGRRGDGASPNRAEAAAMVALALHKQGDKDGAAAWAGEVLAAWRPGWGWGDGRADRLAMEALVAVLGGGLPEQVTLRLALSGSPVWETTLTGEQLREVNFYDLPLPAGGAEGEWTVEAVPAVPGAAWSLRARSEVPHRTPAPNSGLEIAFQLPAKLVRGQPIESVLELGTATGTAPEIKLELPAGVEADPARLEQLRGQGLLTGFDTSDGLLKLNLAPAASTRVVLPLQFRARFAGRLQSGPIRIAPAAGAAPAVAVLPQIWSITSGG